MKASALLAALLSGALALSGFAMDSYDFAQQEYETHLGQLGVKSVTVSGKPATIEFVRNQVKPGDDDSFRIRAQDGKVTVEGGTRGVLYGLYELLERYAGVVWCASWYTHIPKPGRFDVPDGLDETQSPAFPVRWPGWAVPQHNDGLLAVRLRYNSTGHPELAVKGSWSPEKMQKEVARMRSLGIEAIPSLNFSTLHDAWLGDYQYMVSTPEYYKVCSDVIRANDVNFPLTVAHCRQVISPERLKGFLMTHWCKTLPQNLDFILHAIDLTAQCMVI